MSPVNAPLPQSRESLLDTVSTARGSGWVKRRDSKINGNIAGLTSTHPLPRAVLTVPKCNLRLLRQCL
jgi:hypothetical protein